MPESDTELARLRARVAALEAELDRRAGEDGALMQQWADRQAQRQRDAASALQQRFAKAVESLAELRRLMDREQRAVLERLAEIVQEHAAALEPMPVPTRLPAVRLPDLPPADPAPEVPPVAPTLPTQPLAPADVAIESAGVTLLRGDLAGLARARRLSQATMGNIRQNLFFAFVYNVAGIPLAAGLLFPFFGVLLSPAFAALAMALSSVSVIGNALRLRGLRL